MRRLGAWVSQIWRKQEGLDLAGVTKQEVGKVDREEKRSGEEAVWEETTSRS